MEVNNNERFVAGGGTLALGIIGTALGGLATVANGGGASLFGGNRMAEADAKIAKLEAERYTDAAMLHEREHSAAADVLIATLTEKVNQLAQKNAEDIKAFKEEAALRAEIDRKQAKIDILEATAPLSAGIGANTAAISGIQNVLSGITKFVVPSSAVCGTSSSR